MGKNTDFKFHELDRAIVAGDLEAVKDLITVDVSMKIKNRALLMAAKLEKICILEWLIPISDPRSNDSEALFFATRNQCVQSVARLIPVSNPRVKESRTVKEAAGRGSLAILKMLAPASDVKNSNDYLGSPLMIASRFGHVDCVAYLRPLSKTDDKDKKTGETALMMAAAEGRKDCVDLLLPFSNTDSLDFMGFSAVDHALENEHETLAKRIGEVQAAMREAKELALGVSPSSAANKSLSI